MYTSSAKNDPVADEIVKQESGVTMHRRFYKTGKFRVEYTPEEYDRMTDGPDGSRAALLDNVFNKFKQAAIKKLLNDKSEPLHAEFRARVIEMEIKKRKAYDSSFTGIGTE